MIWQRNLYLGLAVGLAVPLGLTIAAIAGGAIPVILESAGLDPAAAAGPVVTTIVDVVSNLAVLILTALFLTQIL
jgi:magnesium transporter